jgi:hypothetical protein
MKNGVALATPKKGLQEQQIFCILERMIGDHPTGSRFVL